MAGRSVLRILDANANRALEGLRVCEDVLRFVYGLSAEYRRLRRLRHQVAAAVSRLPIKRKALLGARDSFSDVGREGSSSRIRSVEQLLVINFQRVKESLRTLEECSRLIKASRARAFQRLRFLTYERERDCLLRLEALRHHR